MKYRVHIAHFNIGFLQINVTDTENIPIENAKISLSYEGRPEDIIRSLSNYNVVFDSTNIV